MPADYNRAERTAGNRAERTAGLIGQAKAKGEQISGTRQDHAVAEVARHSRVVKHWRRCGIAVSIGLPIGLLHLVIGTLAQGNGRAWPAFALVGGVGVFACLALAQHFGIQNALAMTAGLHQAEDATPDAP